MLENNIPTTPTPNEPKKVGTLYLYLQPLNKTIVTRVGQRVSGKIVKKNIHIFPYPSKTKKTKKQQ